MTRDPDRWNPDALEAQGYGHMAAAVRRCAERRAKGKGWRMRRDRKTSEKRVREARKRGMKV